MTLAPNDRILGIDEARMCWGTGQDYWLKYSAANTQLELWSNDSDGSGTSAAVLGIPDGGTDIDVIAGGIRQLEQVIGVDFQSLWTHDTVAVPLPAAAAADDFGCIDGTVGTNAMRLETNDEGQTASEQPFYAAFNWVVPPTYKPGSTVTLRIHGGMLVIADQAATSYLDVMAWVPDYANMAFNDNTVSTDLCETGKIVAFNSATFADHDFVINDDLTGHELTPGTVVQFKIQVSVDDNATVAADVTGVITKIDIIISA